ncbi:hypothetical protein A6M21_00680 [Desulfotomaculum copahuensis]|uniref:Uncharacterized protein n=1 Tax=Desulfotomaculum copahuensis TaxID=1838280 RepID=A0A1B7LCH8_9FIRM|nr:hypothetical protein A6M21_00680 [Desulfotomaculum copahuensis]
MSQRDALSNAGKECGCFSGRENFHIQGRDSGSGKENTFDERLVSGHAIPETKFKEEFLCCRKNYCRH